MYLDTVVHILDASIYLDASFYLDASLGDESVYINVYDYQDVLPSSIQVG